MCTKCTEHCQFERFLFSVPAVPLGKLCERLPPQQGISDDLYSLWETRFRFLQNGSNPNRPSRSKKHYGIVNCYAVVVLLLHDAKPSLRGETPVIPKKNDVCARGSRFNYCAIAIVNLLRVVNSRSRSVFSTMGLLGTVPVLHPVRSCSQKKVPMVLVSSSGFGC